MSPARPRSPLLSTNGRQSMMSQTASLKRVTALRLVRGLEGAADLAGDLEVLARLDHEGAHRAPAEPISASGACSFRAGSIPTPRKPRPGGGPRPDRRRALADSAGEHDRVEPVHRRRHRRDPAAQAVEVHAHGEAARSRRRPPPPRGSPSCRRCRSGRAGRSGARASRRAPTAACPCAPRARGSGPGSTEPERVAITRPSSGVKPIVVSTETPSSDGGEGGAGAQMAGDDAEALDSRPASSAARRDAYSCERPWNPKRRRFQRVRHSRGSAYVVAAAGIRAWKAVSKQATAGTSGSALPTSSSPCSDFGWCSGARSASARSRWTTRSSIRTGPSNSLPPWTIR